MPAKTKQEVKDSVIKMYFDDLKTMPEIAKETGLGSGTVCHIIRKTGRPVRVYTETKKYSGRVTRDELVRLYQDGKSGEEIAEIAGMGSAVAVYYHLHKKGVTMRDQSECHREYSLDDTLFEKVDTELKAYLLGYLFADGYNHEEKNTLQFTQEVKDRYAVDLLRTAFKTEAEVTVVDTVTNYGPTTNAKLLIYNKKVTQDLAKLGCTQAKTFTTVYPSFLSPELQRHFIRGYFDGDGCFSGSKASHQYELAGAEEFLLDMQKELMHTCQLNKTKLAKKKTIHVLRYGGKKQITKIYNYLYEGAEYFLARKKEHAQEYLTAGNKGAPKSKQPS